MASSINNVVGMSFSKTAAILRGLKSCKAVVTQCRHLSLQQDGQEKSDSLAAQFLRASETRSDKPSICRTPESDPTKHNIHHEGLFYTLPDEDFKRWMPIGMEPTFYKMIKAFNETALMIRKPALEIMDCMRKADYSQPTIRYVLYGRDGAGKTSVLTHLMHFCGKQNWLVAHVPWGTTYIRHWRDYQPSTFKPGRVDLPLDSALWLNRFKITNEPVLKSLNPITQARYVWNKREAAEVGTPWLDVIEYGLTRVKYANDIVGVIIKEMKEQSSQGKFRVLASIDGANAFWTQTTIPFEDNKAKKHPSEDISIVLHFRKLLQNDWSGGASVATVDVNAGDLSRTESYLPRYLLGKEGFDHMEPFIPIHVPDYSEKEVNSCIEYYLDRKWLQNPQAGTDQGRKELIFLSAHNPKALYRTCRAW